MTTGRILASVSIVFGGVGVVTLVVSGGRDFLIESGALSFAALAVMLGVLTWLMIPSQSRNGSVWALAWAALTAALYALGVAAAVALAKSEIPGLTFAEFRKLSPSQLQPVAAFAVSFRFWTVVPATLLPLTVGLLLFPSGRPPTPRWRWVGWLSVAAIATSTVATAIVQNPWSTLPIASGQDTVPGVFGQINDFGFAVASLLALVSVASLVVRYRRTSGVERSQIRWIAFGGAIYSVVFIGGGNLPDAPPLIEALAGLLAMSALVVAYGIAITKYRLYGIDVVISKTVTYGVLAAFITGVYAVIVVGIGSLVGNSDEPNLALSIAAVAIVAVAFEPLRRRVQHWANVLVYGRRATPYEVLSNATARLAGASDPDEALASVTQLVIDGTGSVEAVLWLKVGGAMYPRASSPESVLAGLVPATSDEDLADIPGDRVIAVRHRGEVLGALSITKSRTDAVSGSDQKVLEDIAAGAGVLLRNIGLNVELAERAEQLRMSRWRLVAAHDAERRRLERDLHDGAQQQVVALKVKMGIARTLAEREGAEAVAELMASLSDTAQEAVDGMRAVAHGIYPPLLEAEGLEAALNAARRTIHIPVDLNVDGIDRYERSIEESLYFCLLGVVADAADAGATLATIALNGQDDVVRFSVVIDSAVGELVAVVDRVDALSGVLGIERAAEGSTVSGEMPARNRALESA